MRCIKNDTSWQAPIRRLDKSEKIRAFYPGSIRNEGRKAAMDKELAKEFAERAKEYSDWFNAMTELTIRLEDEDREHAKRTRRALANGFLDLDEVLILSLRKGHPELFTWFKD